LLQYERPQVCAFIATVHDCFLSVLSRLTAMQQSGMYEVYGTTEYNTDNVQGISQCTLPVIIIISRPADIVYPNEISRLFT